MEFFFESVPNTISNWQNSSKDNLVKLTIIFRNIKMSMRRQQGFVMIGKIIC